MMRSNLPLLFVLGLLGSSASLSAQAAPPVTPPPGSTVVTPQTRTAAQDLAGAAGKSVSNDQISTAIRRSGLSEAQVRARLSSAGYDASLADPFFARVAAGAPLEAGAPAASAEFAKALQSLGIIDGTELPAEEPLRNAAEATSNAGGVFGKEIFRRASTAFDPVTAGPVDPGYRLGVGDQLQVVLTGQVELAYQLDIRRDGSVVMPQVGQVPIAGLTLESARATLRARAAQSYSGLQSGETRLDLTISGVRTNAIFVIGEIEEPGAYQVNALATVFHAIARAGGPTVRGSFRLIEVRRGGRVVHRVDLYRYLLDGDARDDIRLEQGDVIFVPLNTRAVAVTGAVRRPRIFELIGAEGFNDLLRFAGGLSTRASVDRVQVDRILPAEQRAPGFDRVKIDVRLDGQLSRAAAFPLLDGDVLTVFEIGDLRRNTVQIAGAVFQPGEFEYREGMTLDSLVSKAKGLLPFALRDRVLVRRMIVESGRTESFRVSLDSVPGGQFVIREFDSVEILDGRRDFPARTVAVVGAVNGAGEKSFLEKETLRDLVDRSGGFIEGAQIVELSRRKVGAAYSDSTSVVARYFAGTDFAPGGPAAAVIIEPFDRVEVRLAPGYRGQRFVSVSGEFTNPGSYAISENLDRVSDLVRRAGGLLPHAYGESFQLVRDGRPVAINFARAMSRERDHDIQVLAGDVLRIAADPRTVRVEGAVGRPSLVRYEPGLSVMDYIERAGGPTERAQRHRAVVDYPNGLMRRVRRHFGLVVTQPDIVSGAVITVPTKPEEKTSSAETFTRFFQITSGIASLVIAFVAATR